MGVVLGLCILVGFLVFVPLLLVGLLLKLLGLALRLALGLVFGVVGVVLAGAALILIPLLPILFLIGGIWLIARLVRRPAAVRLAA